MKKTGKITSLLLSLSLLISVAQTNCCFLGRLFRNAPKPKAEGAFIVLGRFCKSPAAIKVLGLGCLMGAAVYDFRNQDQKIDKGPKLNTPFSFKQTGKLLLNFAQGDLLSSTYYFVSLLAGRQRTESAWNWFWNKIGWTD